MTNKKWLSVIMPTWNGEKFLRSALDSVAVQKEDDLEIIAVDDGSADSTTDILESYSRQLSINIIKKNHTGNWVANTNIGLSEASGKYVSFLHQDDIWLPGRVKRLKALADKQPDVVLFLHPSYFIDENSKKIGTWTCPLPKNQKPLLPDLVLPKLIVQNFISMPGPLFKRQAVMKAGFLDEQLWYTADWKLWMQLSCSGPVLYCPEPLSGFRIHFSSLTAKRSVNLPEFRHQIKAIIDQFLPVVQAKNISGIKQLAEFSLEVNSTLAAAAWSQPFSMTRLLRQCFSLGPLLWVEYMRYSRIFERIQARLRVGMNNLNHRIS
ncbi:MAG: glycosyltransferase [Desulfobacterales bacterium]|nr:glycosyltransferase [Desulfobacterales bacterium]